MKVNLVIYYMICNNFQAGINIFITHHNVSLIFIENVLNLLFVVSIINLSILCI